MPRRLLLTLSLIWLACGSLIAQTPPERPGNVRRSVSDDNDAAAELPSSFFQLPKYGDPSVPPKTEPQPAPPAAEPIPPPLAVAVPPAEPESSPQMSSRRILNQPKLVLDPPPPATLPPLTPPQPMAPMPLPLPQFDSAVAPVAHTHSMSAEAKRELAADAPLPLAPRSADAEKGLDRPATAAATPSVASIAGALAAVVGLFLLFAWCTRRTLPQGMSRLPIKALEVLGRMPIHGKQEFQLVRVGNKLVLLAVSPMGMESVAEVDDPAEVDRICALCKRTAPGSITESFREVLGQLGGETTRGGFAGEFARAAPSVRERAGR